MAQLGGSRAVQRAAADSNGQQCRLPADNQSGAVDFPRVRKDHRLVEADPKSDVSWVLEGPQS
jgi:hypothetical protein